MGVGGALDLSLLLPIYRVLPRSRDGYERLANPISFYAKLTPTNVRKFPFFHNNALKISISCSYKNNIRGREFSVELTGLSSSNHINRFQKRKEKIE